VLYCVHEKVVFEEKTSHPKVNISKRLDSFTTNFKKLVLQPLRTMASMTPESVWRFPTIYSFRDLRKQQDIELPLMISLSVTRLREHTRS